MKEKQTLFSVISFDKETKQKVSEEYSLDSYFFVGGSIKQLLEFISKRLVDNVESFAYQEFVHTFENGSSYKFSVKEMGKVLFVVSSVVEYPAAVIKLLVSDIHAGKGSTKQLLKEYQDYVKKNIFVQIQMELTQTKSILTKTVESAIGRGEKLDDLISTAKELEGRAKSLYSLSRKQNKRCCRLA
jgi:Synaptobrevin